jgi:hypothetical protein
MESNSWFTSGWFKSSYSSPTGQCVECARTPDGGMAVRDSKRPCGGALAFPRHAWREFVASTHASETVG